jgi:3-oxoacyl-[acyl-carrier protein] reductase
MELKNKTIVVTGAAQGLGRKMAEMLAGEGAKLALADLDEAKLLEAAQACEAAGGEAKTYRLNVSDEASVEGFFAEVAKDFGGVDGLINNAGVNSDGLLVKLKEGKVVAKMSLAQFNRVIGVDLAGVFLCGREAAAHMAGSGNGGVIVNISSISRAGNIGQTNYSAAKAGVAAMTVTWAKELARYNIRVGAIAPGFCDTRMVAGIRDDIRQKIIAGIPLRRLAAPQEIGETALYILHNDYFTGRVIEIDGGLRL